MVEVSDRTRRALNACQSVPNGSNEARGRFEGGVNGCRRPPKDECERGNSGAETNASMEQTWIGEEDENTTKCFQ